MKTTTWAVFGSLFINLVLGVSIAALFSAAPTARAAEPSHCTGAHAVRSNKTPASPAKNPAPVISSHRPYLVDVRMGWGPGG